MSSSSHENDSSPEPNQQPATRVINPYAISRSSRSIPEVSSRSLARSPKVGAAAGVKETAAPAESRVLPAVEDAGQPAEDAAQPEEDVLNERLPLAENSVPTSAAKKSVGNLPPWQRLPSRNVTFGSAEILTVSELRSHGLIYANRSVRITGVLLQRYVQTQPNGQPLLTFVVGDPLTGARPPPARHNSLLSARNVHSTSTSTNSSTAVMKPRAGLATKAPLAGKRKLVHRPKTSSQSSALLGQKRRLVTTPKAPSSSIQSLRSCLLEQPSVLVIANPSHVQTNDFVVGDLILVMGEVHDQDSASTAVQLVLNQLVERQQAQNDGEQQNIKPFCLQVRILGNANGTDMKLHYETLKLRRKHLLDRNEIQRKRESPLLGCGPPPYDASG